LIESIVDDFAGVRYVYCGSTRTEPNFRSVDCIFNESHVRIPWHFLGGIEVTAFPIAQSTVELFDFRLLFEISANGNHFDVGVPEIAEPRQLILESDASSSNGIVGVESLDQLHARHKSSYTDAEIVDVLDCRILLKFLQALQVIIPFTVQDLGNEFQHVMGACTPIPCWWSNRNWHFGMPFKCHAT
jgi:hypothetical protein